MEDSVHDEQDRCQEREQKDNVAEYVVEVQIWHPWSELGDDARKNEILWTRQDDGNLDEEVVFASAFKWRRKGVELLSWG